jgi:hypothetical protein
MLLKQISENDREDGKELVDAESDSTTLVIRKEC